MSSKAGSLPVNEQQLPFQSGTKPALDPCWCEPLHLLPYPAPPPRADGGGDAMPSEQRAQVLECWQQDLTTLLRLPYHVFWSQVLFDESVHTALRTYLERAPRHYQLAHCLVAEPSEAERRISRDVLLVHIRMGACKESREHHLDPHTFGELVRRHGLFDVPRLMDLCVLYGRGNARLLGGMVGNVFARQPQLYADLGDALATAVSAFERCCRDFGLGYSLDPETEPPPPARISAPPETVLDLMLYLADIAATLTWLLRTHPAAGGQYRVHRIGLHLAGLFTACVPSLEHFVATAAPDLAAHLETVRHALLSGYGEVFRTAFLEPEPEAGGGGGAASATVAAGDAEAVLFHLEVVVKFEGFVAAYARGFGLLSDLRALKGRSAAGGVDDSVRFEYAIRRVEVALEEADADARASAPAPPRPQKPQVKPARRANIKTMRDMMPELGEGFLDACLDAYEDDVQKVIERIFEDNLPPHLKSTPRTLPLGGTEVLEAIPALKANPSALDTAQTGRRNLYDGDEFDVFANPGQVDLRRIHVGKKSGDGDMFRLLDDKSHVSAFRDQYLYEDEYDDTYDDVGQEGNLDAADDDDAAFLRNTNHYGRGTNGDGDGDGDGDGEGGDGDGADAGPGRDVRGGGGRQWQNDRPPGRQRQRGGGGGGPPRGKPGARGGRGGGRGGRGGNNSGGGRGGRGGGGSGTRGGGRGGRGGGGGRGGAPGAHMSDRAKKQKDKNKASRANHNRRRGADRKRNAGMGFMPPAGS